MNRVPTRLDVYRFYEQLRHSDIDFTITEIERVIGILTTYHTLLIDPSEEKAFFDRVVYKPQSSEAMVDKSHNKTLQTVLFRLISLLGRYYSYPGVAYLFKILTDTLKDEENPIPTQYVSVICEILSYSDTFDDERRYNIVGCLYPILVRELGIQSNDALSYFNTVSSAFLEYLGFCLSPQQISTFLVKILANQACIPLLRALVPYACYNDIEILMKHLGDNVEVMSACCVKAPDVFRRHAKTIATLFMQDPSADNLYSLASIFDAAHYELEDTTDELITLSLQPLLDEFEDLNSYEHSSEYSINNDIDDGLNGARSNDEDSADQDDDIVDSFIDPDYIPVLYDGDAWKLRRASIVLAKVLTKHVPQKMQDTLSHEDVYSAICELLKASYSTTLRETMDFVLLVIEKCSLLDVFYWWINTVGEECSKYNPECLLYAIDFFERTTNALKTIPGNIISVIIKGLSTSTHAPRMDSAISLVMKLMHDSEDVSFVKHFILSSLTTNSTLIIYDLIDLYIYDLSRDTDEQDLLKVLLQRYSKEETSKGRCALSVTLLCSVKRIPIDSYLNQILQIGRGANEVNYFLLCVAVLAASPTQRSVFNNNQGILSSMISLIDLQTQEMSTKVLYTWLLLLEKDLVTRDQLGLIIPKFAKSFSSGSLSEKVIILEILNVASQIVSPSKFKISELYKHFPDFIRSFDEALWPDLDVVGLIEPFYRAGPSLIYDVISELSIYAESCEDINMIRRCAGFIANVSRKFGMTPENRETDSCFTYMLVAEGFDTKMTFEECMSKISNVEGGLNTQAISSAIGRLATLDVDVYLPLLLERAKGSEFPTFSNAFYVFIKSVSRLNHSQASDISVSLRRGALKYQETRFIVSECIANIHKFMGIDSLALLKEKEPVTSMALAILVKRSKSDLDKIRVLTEIHSYINTDYPEFSLPLIQILLDNITTVERIGIQLTNIIECFKKRDSHTIVKMYATLSESVDIGVDLRVSALTLVSKLPQFIHDFNYLIDSLEKSIKDEASEVKAASLKVFRSVIESGMLNDTSINRILGTLCENERDLCKSVEVHFMKTLLCLKMYNTTNSSFTNTLKNLFNHYTTNPTLLKLEQIRKIKSTRTGKNEKYEINVALKILDTEFKRSSGIAKSTFLLFKH